MNVSKLVSLAFLLFFFANCSNDDSAPQQPEEAGNEIYFTLNVLGPRDLGAVEEWIVIHDQHGNLLDYSRFSVGEVLKFEAAPEVITEHINVTELKYSSIAGSNGKIYTISTTQIAKGTEWSFGTDQVNSYIPPVLTGNFQLTVANIPGLFTINISNKSNRVYGGYLNSQKMYTFNHSIPKYEGENDYIVSILDNSNNLKYYDFTNAEGTDIAVNYNEFKDFDAYLEVDIPDNTLLVLNVGAFEEGVPYSNFNGYWLHDLIVPWNDLPTGPLRIGYLDRFERHRTGFFIKMAGYEYGISQYGNRLEELIVPPKPGITVTDPSFIAYKFDADINFSTAVQRWSYVEGSSETNDYISVSWSYSSLNGVNLIIGNLPDEILSIHPEISIEKLAHRSTQLNLPANESDYVGSHSVTVFTE